MRQVLFWGIGILFLVMTFIGGFTYIRDSNFVNQATVATAIIIDKYTTPNPNSDTEPNFFVEYQFRLADNSVVMDEAKVSYSEFVGVYNRLGSQFTVHYDDQNPTRNLFDAERDFPNRLTSLLLIFGISVMGFVFAGVDLLWKRRRGLQVQYQPAQQDINDLRM